MLKANILLEKDDKTGRLRLAVKGDKLVAFIGMAALTLLIVVLCTFACRLPAAYNAYEGVLVEVKDDWLTSYFDDDSYPQKCLVIRDGKGRQFKRFTDEYVLFQHRIEEGDTLEKQKGFFKKPYARGKETMAEMIKRCRKSGNKTEQ